MIMIEKINDEMVTVTAVKELVLDLVEPSPKERKGNHSSLKPLHWPSAV